MLVHSVDMPNNKFNFASLGRAYPRLVNVRRNKTRDRQ